ncbi:hypothetical protein [Candidatus Mycoplasma mahonii]|uniref:hypothetical protein n=1 Tax=Candidatus Mycoplasma mahonii TaxID=3004105 RepID=UPI0026EB23AB|nr:hypothetical protein [Candidatus Mycoplasma mahonii]WKX02755.1 hypothetical protein O3I44_01635 [Candidatus Mycoplasma mahonii]
MILKDKTTTKIIRKGYLNTVYKQDDLYIREPKEVKSNLENEVKIFNALNIKTRLNNSGVMTRSWINGETIVKWTSPILNLVKEKIEELHKLHIDGLSVHDWTKYDKWLAKLPMEYLSDFKNKRNLLKNYNHVVSHNDLNKENMLINKGKITFIDYEWSNMNVELFDYVQFYVTEGELLVKKSNEFNELLFVSLCYFYLWTFDVPKSNFVLHLRAKYKKMLSK